MINKNILVINSGFDNERLFRDSYLQYAHDRGCNMKFFTYDIKEHYFFILKKMLFKHCAKYRALFYRKMDQQVLELLKEVEYVCLINLPSYNCEPTMGKDVYEAIRQKKSVLYFVDSVKEHAKKNPFLSVFKKIYVLEEKDIDILERCKVGTVKLQLFGTFYSHFQRNLNSEKIFDICFVGLATPERMAYIESIAKYCKENGKIFWLSGHFWNTSHWWTTSLSRWNFKRKYPYATEYVKSMYVMPRDLAEIYCGSRIVININIAAHKMLNTRILDAMACKALVITDKQVVKDVKIVSEKHFFEVTSPDEMVNKIDSFLKNDKAREKIVNLAFDVVKKNYDAYNALDEMFFGGL